MPSARNNLKAYVLYKNDKLVPGVLVLRTKKPTGNNWSEVPARCCSDVTIPGFFRSHGPLKGYIKYAKDGYVISSSTILRSKKPSQGRWVELPIHLCCEYSTTSTTTTSTSTSTSTTSSTTTTTTTIP